MLDKLATGQRMAEFVANPYRPPLVPVALIRRVRHVGVTALAVVVGLCGTGCGPDVGDALPCNHRTVGGGGVSETAVDVFRWAEAQRRVEVPHTALIALLRGEMSANMGKPAPPAAALYDVRRIEVVNARATGPDAGVTVVAVARDWLWFEAARLPADRILIGLGSPNEAGDAHVMELIGIRADGQTQSYTRCRPTAASQLDAFFEARRQSGVSTAPKRNSSKRSYPATRRRAPPGPASSPLRREALTTRQPAGPTVSGHCAAV